MSSLCVHSGIDRLNIISVGMSGAFSPSTSWPGINIINISNINIRLYFIHHRIGGFNLREREDEGEREDEDQGEEEREWVSP